MTGASREPYPCIMTGGEVEAVMDRLGLSSRELSRMIGIHWRQIDRWRSGAAHVGAAHALLLLNLVASPTTRLAIANGGLDRLVRTKIRALELGAAA